MLNFLRDHNVMLSSHISSNLLLATMVMGISVFSYGFETGVLDTIQAMPFFIQKFGQYDPATKEYVISPKHLSYLNSFPLILYGLGVIVASQIGERYGRRTVFLVMNCICLSGVAICYTAQNFAQILAGRMIIMMHVGFEAWLIPMFQAEIVPAAIRGSMVSTYVFNHIFATFISSTITNATSKYSDDSSWKIPIACMFTFPSLALLLMWMVPESPRWLLRKGKKEKAATQLYYLNSARPGFVVEDQIKLLCEPLDQSVEKGQWKDLIRGVNRRRTVTACIAAAASQLTGQSFASTYGTIFIASINIMDPFTATLIKRGILCIGPILVILLVDRIGRRKTFFTFGSLSAASLLTMGAMGSVANPSEALKKGIVAIAIFFPFCYISSFGSIMQVVPAEMPHISLRDKTLMLSWSTSNVSNFVASFTLPYLLSYPYANLGAKVAFIYGASSVLFIIWAFLYVPELTGRSLEEVDEMFEAKIPAWRSQEWVSTSGNAKLTQLENSKNLEGVEGKNDLTEIEHIETVASHKD